MLNVSEPQFRPTYDTLSLFCSAICVHPSLQINLEDIVIYALQSTYNAVE